MSPFRAIFTLPDGSEHVRIRATIDDARYAIPCNAIDWVIVTLERMYPGEAVKVWDASKNLPECSICRGNHGPEIQHACE